MRSLSALEPVRGLELGDWQHLELRRRGRLGRSVDQRLHLERIDHDGRFDVHRRVELYGELELRQHRDGAMSDRARVTLAAAVIAATLAGCDPGFKPSIYIPGDVTYGCAGFADAVCDQVFPELQSVDPDVTAFPPIALGAKFGVTLGVSLSPDRLDQTGTETMVARREGVASVTDGDHVSHFEVRKAASIRVTHETEYLSDTFSEIFGEDAFALRIPDRFRAVPIDDGGHMLAGDFDTEWTSSNEAVVSVESDPATNIVTFRINGTGMATLTVKMGELETAVPFDIQ